MSLYIGAGSFGECMAKSFGVSTSVMVCVCGYMMSSPMFKWELVD